MSFDARYLTFADSIEIYLHSLLQDISLPRRPCAAIETEPRSRAETTKSRNSERSPGRAADIRPISERTNCIDRYIPPSPSCSLDLARKSLASELMTSFVLLHHAYILKAIL